MSNNIWSINLNNVIYLVKNMKGHKWNKLVVPIYFILEWIHSILRSHIIRLEWFRSILEWNHSRVISQIIIIVNNFFIRRAREIIPSPINSQNKPWILRRGLDIKFQKHLEQIRSNMEQIHSNMEWIHSKWNGFVPK